MVFSVVFTIFSLQANKHPFHRRNQSSIKINILIFVVFHYKLF